MNRQTRTALLWAFIPMGYIFHTLCELIPLFAGLSIATEEMTTEMLPAMTAFTGWMLYLVPLVGLLCSCYGKRRWSTIVSFVLACLTLLLNVGHLCSDLLPHFSWGQAAILPFVCVVAALLVIDLWKELRTSKAQ